MSFFLDSNYGESISYDYLMAINAGILTKEFAVIPSCPSGNCTCPLLDSVDLCTQCKNVTASTMLGGCNDTPLAIRAPSTRCTQQASL